MTRYEIRYSATADTITALKDGQIVKVFTCAYRGRVKATFIALEWLGTRYDSVEHTEELDN